MSTPGSSTDDAPGGADGQPESHRDRKARLTRRAIHVAAVRRVLSDGLDHATVAQIAAEAGVSTRTFFNYFSSKEDAIVGFTEHNLDDEQIAAFLEAPTESGHAIAVETARLIHTAFMMTFNDDEVAAGRRRIFALHPELMRRQMEKNEHLVHQVGEIVARRLERTENRIFGDDVSVDEAAEMLVLIGASPLRAAARRLKAGADRREAAGDADAGASEDLGGSLYDEALVTFASILEGIGR